MVKTMFKQKAIRDAKHLERLAGLPCSVPGCGNPCGPPHHLMRTGSHGMGRKADDNEAVPICPPHHHEVTLVGDERVWWKAQGVDYDVLIKFGDTLYHETNVNLPIGGINE